MQILGTIKIYQDAGVGQKSLCMLLNELSQWKTSFISSKEIIHTSWEDNTSLLIFPGGRDVPYHNSLKGKGNHRIRKYVENGGSFLGICAGAYYGCGAVEFDRGMELEVIGLRELAFFPGIARGPAYGPGTFRYQSEFGARASLISNHLSKEPFMSYHNGGCYFVETDRYPNIKIISNYLDIDTHPAAIVEVPVGKGKVILSGVHIEMGTSQQPTILDQKMWQALMPFEAQRKHFLNQLLSSLLAQ
jgi:glutamine amidotransferase-like uncharacterized protein